MDRKTILVTGAAGAVGREVIRELVKAPGKFKVRAMDLPGRNTLKVLRPFLKNIELVTGSVEDAGTVREAAAGVDMVIHLAAVIPPFADEHPDIAGRVNVWGTHNVISAMKAASPGAFLLYSSSVAVYGDRVHSSWISVDDPMDPSEGDLYAGTKITAEGLVKNSGLRYSIFRFTGIMNPGQVTSGRPDPLMFHMPLDTSMEIATTRDCGFALSRAPYHLEKLDGRVFNLAGGEACRIKYRELLRRTFEVVGLDFSRLREDAFATRNFHCGFFLDSGELEDILHFQRDSIESYLGWVKESLPLGRRILTWIGRHRAVRFLLKSSDPLKARLAGNQVLIHRFFEPGSTAAAH